jgi:hypothetical protein
MKKQHISLQVIRKRFLKMHGSVLLAAGIFGAATTIAGAHYSWGPFDFLNINQVASIGFFEAYLLASGCGIFLLVGSLQENSQKWNRMGALVHLPLLITNITHWEFYGQFGLEAVGIISTTAHVALICIESFFGFRKDK